MNRTDAARILLLGAAVCLAGCAGADMNGAKGCAGINDVQIGYEPSSGKVGARLCGGKENETVKLLGETPNGLKFHYEAQGAKAFAGQMTQAQLSQALSRERHETIRELITIVQELSPLSAAPAR